MRAYEPNAEWGWCYPDKLYEDRLLGFKEEEPEMHYAAP
jgi:hypothetical protein